MKLTPSIYKSIKELAISLPAVHRVDTNGNFLYKSMQNEKIYMIESYLQTLTHYIIVDNENYFVIQ